MKADTRLSMWLVLLLVALAFALAFSCAPVSTVPGVAAQASRVPPGPPRPQPGPERPTAAGPTVPVPTGPSEPGGPEVTGTPQALPPTGGATGTNATWLLAGLILILSGMGIYVITSVRQRMRLSGEKERVRDER
jgi:hypothetical protein